jgi:hypothetical protein
MNWLDVLLLGILTGALLWGMLRGVKSQLIGLLSLCLAVGLALWFYPDLATFLRGVLPRISRQGRETIAFLFLLIVVSNLINYAVRSSTTPPEERRRETYYPAEEGLEAALARGVQRFILSPLNMLGGMSLAFISACIWLGLIMTIMRLSFAAGWPAYDGIRLFFYTGFSHSTLLGLFNDAFQIAYASIYALMAGEAHNPLNFLVHRFAQLHL